MNFFVKNIWSSKNSIQKDKKHVKYSKKCGKNSDEKFFIILTYCIYKKWNEIYNKQKLARKYKNKTKE